MGTTHFRSNVTVKAGTVTAKTVAATTLTGGTSITAPTVHSSGHVKLGDHQYILFGSANVEATIVAAATAVDASCKGSLYMSGAGTLWVFDADDTATRVTLY